MFRLLWQESQTAAVALLVAILTWVFADSANVRIDKVWADVQPISPPGTTLLIDPPIIGKIGITFEASASQDQEMHELAQKGGPLHLKVSAVPGGIRVDLDHRVPGG